MAAPSPPRRNSLPAASSSTSNTASAPAEASKTACLSSFSPDTLPLGCGSCGGNLTSDNVDYRAYGNITRVAFPIGCRTVTPRKVTEETLFGAFWERFGR